MDDISREDDAEHNRSYVNENGSTWLMENGCVVLGWSDKAMGNFRSTARSCPYPVSR